MMNNFIDKVFVISVDDNELKICDYGLVKQGIGYEKFEGVVTNSAVGLNLSMIKLFKLCLERGYQNVLVLEDDALWKIPRVPDFIVQCFPQLPKDYFCLHLGINLLSQPERISENILRVDQAFSSHAIIYSRDAIEFILPIVERQPEIPYDITLRREVQPTGKVYCTMPMICTQRDRVSRIEGKFTQWDAIMAQTYAMHTKNLQYYPNQKGEIIKCYNGHMIDGIPITVDPNKHEIQNSNLIGKPCDCRRMIYGEEDCGCTVKQWEVKWKENINA